MDALLTLLGLAATAAAMAYPTYVARMAWYSLRTW